jgi:hypothetical protein
MRLRTRTAILLTAFLLFMAPLGMAGQEIAGHESSTLRDDVGALKRGLLLLLSMSLGRAGSWKEASVVSKHLVDTADDPFEACVAQAAVVWQMTEEGPYFDATYKEWEKLGGTVNRVGADGRFTPEEKAACRLSYRRVTGNLIDGGMRTTDLGRASYEKIRVVFVAYLGAAQQGVAADGRLGRFAPSCARR